MEPGQFLFGSPNDFRYCGDMALHGLQAIADAVDEDNFGYASHYENDVFALRPDCDYDCSCGFEEQEEAWEEANPHKDFCWIKTYECLPESAYGCADEDLLKAAKKVGWKFNTTDGIAVYCDCGSDSLYRQWCENHYHSEKCLLVLPNFEYKPTHLKICWYKYIGRGMLMNAELSSKEWAVIMVDCIKSLGVNKNES